MSKLKGLPHITYINMANATIQNKSMIDQFKKYNISDFDRFNAWAPKRSRHNKLWPAEFGCMLSHLNIIEKFYNNSKEEMLIIVEDDLDISTIDNWDFSWKEFITAMPEFEILQLVRNQTKQQYARLKKWEWEDKSTGAYIITKEYAKKIVDIYSKDKRSLYTFPNLDERKGPVADYALYKDFNSLSTCIFKQFYFGSQTSKYPKYDWFAKQEQDMEEFWSVNHGLEDIL